MSLSRIGMEDNELIMQIEDLPSYNYTILGELMQKGKRNSERHVATEFINALDGGCKYKRLEEIGYLYDFAFHKRVVVGLFF